tara:strand:+ start:396 stop:746 length:351 start_codon:yes stop_codon:yes gene_type:complete
LPISSTRKLKSLRTQLPKVSKLNPAMSIINAVNLYLVASNPHLSNKVSTAKEFSCEKDFCTVFLDDENIFKTFVHFKLIEFFGDRERKTNMCSFKKQKTRTCSVTLRATLKTVRVF